MGLKYFNIFLLFLFLNVKLFSQSNNAVYNYFNEINVEMSKVEMKCWEYIQLSSATRGVQAVEVKRQELLTTMRLSRAVISKKGNFEGDSSLRRGAIAYIDSGYKILNYDLKQTLILEAKADSSFVDYEKYTNIQASKNKSFDRYFDKYVAVLDRFKMKHKDQINITVNLNGRLKRALEVFAYYEQISLIFQRSNFDDRDLAKLTKMKDSLAYDKARLRLLKSAQQGLVKLNKCSSFEGDSSLIVACRKTLNFYIENCTIFSNELKAYYAEMNDYIKAREQFNLISKAKRTSQDIALMNARTATHNSFTKKFVSRNDANNNLKIRLHNDFNTAGINFTKNFIAKLK